MKPGDVYLLAYNAVQFLGWGSILVKTVGGLLAGLAYPQLYANVELELKIFQTAAILEIIHCMIGLVRSPIGTTLTQVFSRVIVLWLILYKVESSRASIGVPMLLIAWSITEVIRYSFYALNLLNAVPGVLTRMRYTFSNGLYLIGAGGELLTMIAALPEIAARNHFTLDFFLYHVVIFLCLICIPFFPQLYRKIWLPLASNDTNQQKLEELTKENEQQKQDFEGHIARLLQERKKIIKRLSVYEMLVQLPLENWFDLLAFVPRCQLGNIACQIGDRQFAYILQSFLHEYRRITLGPIEIIPPRPNVPSDSSMVRGCHDEYAATDLPDWPMPQNIKNFDGISLSYVDEPVLVFLRKFQTKSLLANVNLDLTHGRHILPTLNKILPLISSTYSIEFGDLFDMIHDNGYISQPLLSTLVAQTRILSIKSRRSFYVWQQQIDWCCSWLYTTRNDGMPRALISEYISGEWTRCSSFINRIKKDFVEANHSVSFFIRLTVPRNHQQEISLNNNKTNETLVVKEGAERLLILHGQRIYEKILLISRHSSKVAKHKIEEDEKEIFEWAHNKRTKRIKLN